METTNRPIPVDAETRLRIGAEHLGIVVDEHARTRLLDLLAVFLNASRSFNLTSIREPLDAVEAHLLDSLAVLRTIEGPGVDGWTAPRVLDVGTGGGFPGLAIAAVWPEVSVTLLDSVAKKVEACRSMAEVLGWANVTCICERAETFARGSQREAYDLVTARAVAQLAIVLELTLPFARVGGDVLLWKGPSLDGSEEWSAGLSASEVLGGTLAKRDAFALPWSGAERRILRFTKRAATPDRFPRRAGIPGKRPLR